MMSKEINIVNLTRIFAECHAPFSVTNVRSPYDYIPGMSDPANYAPVCDISLTLNGYYAKYIATNFIKLGEALKKEMAEE